MLECVFGSQRVGQDVPCPAQIKIRKVLKFPRWSVEQDATDTEKRRMMRQLRAVRDRDWRLLRDFGVERLVVLKLFFLVNKRCGP